MSTGALNHVRAERACVSAKLMSERPLRLAASISYWIHQVLSQHRGQGRAARKDSNAFNSSSSKTSQVDMSPSTLFELASDMTALLQMSAIDWALMYTLMARVGYAAEAEADGQAHCFLARVDARAWMMQTAYVAQALLHDASIHHQFWIALAKLKDHVQLAEQALDMCMLIDFDLECNGRDLDRSYFHVLQAIEPHALTHYQRNVAAEEAAKQQAGMQQQRQNNTAKGTLSRWRIRSSSARGTVDDQDAVVPDLTAVAASSSSGSTATRRRSIRPRDGSSAKRRRRSSSHQQGAHDDREASDGPDRHSVSAVSKAAHRLTANLTAMWI